MEVSFKASNQTFHKIIEIDGAKYLLDISSIPSTYYWGGLPSKITGKMVKLKEHDNSFETISSTADKSITIPIGLIIGGGIYRYFNRIFEIYDLSSNMLLKLGLFFLSAVLSLVLYFCITFFVHRLAIKNMDLEQYKITFLPESEKRNFFCYRVLSIFSIISLVCLVFYMLIDNGTEGALLFINTLIWLGFWVLSIGGLPVRESFEKQDIVFDKIEKT